MEAWREKLDKFLDGDLKLFEQDYKITYPCVLKRNKKRIKAKIDMEHGVIYDLEGEEIGRVKAV
ncbi:hypothetical protein [Clostridium botulinum]|uniref:hypothetical protein n=1 Tax=Clostridium botulinum TaxID=1491 RepID=UPI00174D8744|nr:hypothetical protein [Clostridium botulinum]MBD5572377.1 hypothetical protein [Clostridium botulinum]